MPLHRPYAAKITACPGDLGDLGGPAFTQAQAHNSELLQLTSGHPFLWDWGGIPFRGVELLWYASTQYSTSDWMLGDGVCLQNIQCELEPLKQNLVHNVMNRQVLLGIQPGFKPRVLNCSETLLSLSCMVVSHGCGMVMRWTSFNPSALFLSYWCYGVQLFHHILQSVMSRLMRTAKRASTMTGTFSSLLLIPVCPHNQYFTPLAHLSGVQW